MDYFGDTKIFLVLHDGVHLSMPPIYCKAEKLDNNRFDVAGSHTDAGKTQVYDDEENRAVSQLEGAIETKTYLEPTLIVVANDQFAKRYYPSGFGQNECHFEYWLGN